MVPSARFCEAVFALLGCLFSAALGEIETVISEAVFALLGCLTRAALFVVGGIIGSLVGSPALDHLGPLVVFTDPRLAILV
jgi:hypothetical protein